MNSEEKFKNLLKEKLKSQEFPFNPENWDKAKDLIDADRQRKRRALPFIFLGCGLLFLSLISLLFFGYSETEKKQVHAENAMPLPKGELKAPPMNAPDKKIGAESPQPPSQVTLPAPKSAAVYKQAELNNIPSQPAEKPKSQKQDAKPSEQQTTREVTKATSPATDAKPSVAQPVQLSTGQMSLAMKRKNSQKAPLSNDSPVKTTAPEPLVETAKEQAVETPAQASSPEIINEVENTTNTETKKEESSAQPIAAELSDPAVTAPATVTASTDETAVPLSENIGLSKLKDSLTEPKNIFSIEAGATYLLGWNGYSSKDANGFNPLIGANYLRVVSQRIYASIGVHYTSIVNLSNYSHESIEGRYSFGREGAVTVITPEKMQYLIAPLKVAYVFDIQNMLGAGYTFGYLLGIENKVETYTQKLNTVTDKKISRSTGYAQGFNSFDSQFSVFYRRGLYPNLSANLEAFYGLSDIKKNSFFGVNAFERNLGMKLTLIYNLFKK